jgi:hypothetical protein
LVQLLRQDSSYIDYAAKPPAYAHSGQELNFGNPVSLHFGLDNYSALTHHNYFLRDGNVARDETPASKPKTSAESVCSSAAGEQALTLPKRFFDRLSLQAKAD